MYGRESITTVSDYLTGTVSISPGSSTVTGVGTGWTSTQANGQYFMQFPSQNDWYRATATTGPTNFTIEQPYQQSTALSGSSYILRKMFYSLSSTADEIVDVRNWNTPLKVIQIDPRSIDDLRPNPESTNSSYGYCTWGYDTSGNIQVSPYPFPSDDRLFEIRTKLRPVAMVNSTDVPSVPNKYRHVIAWGAIAIGFGFMQKWEPAAGWDKKYQTRVTEMKKEYRMSEDNQPILKSIDSIQRAKWISLPEQYPVITSG